MVFQAHLLPRSYLHCFKIDIDEIPVLFEPEEDHKYRAVVDPSQSYDTDRLDRGLMAAIVAVWMPCRRMA